MAEILESEVSCRGRVARVEVSGTGPDVVMVGTAVPMAWTRPAALELTGHGFRVTNFDYGAGDASPEPRTALDQVDDVLTVMDAVGVAEAVIVGLSRGAMTAYGLASRHPSRSSGLVLSFPVAGWDDTLYIADEDPVPEEGEEQAAFMFRLLRRIFSAEFLAERLADAQSLVTTEPGSVVRVDRFEEDPFDADDSVSCPTLIIEGGLDQIVLPEHPRRYLSAIPTAQHVVVEDAEHGWLMERPDRFAEIVTSFLASV